MIELFVNERDFQDYVPVNTGFGFESLKADIDSALRKSVLPYLSRAQFDVSFISSSPKHLELISLVKKASAQLAIYRFLPQAAVQLDGDSIVYTVERSKQATPEDKANLTRSFQLKGMEAVEDMLVFLEANDDTFTDWKASESYTKYAGHYIRTADEFKIIGGSRMVFLQTFADMEEVEFELEAVLPEEIRFKILARGDFGTDVAAEKLVWKKLLKDYLQVVVRCKALASALNRMALVIGENNTISVFDNSTANMTKGYVEASDRKIAVLRDDLNLKASNRLVLLNGFLEEHAEILGFEKEKENMVVPFRNSDASATKFF